MQVDRRDVLAAGGFAAAILAVPALARAASMAETTPNWRSLFNGKDLDGWTFFEDGVGDADTHHAISIENHVLHFLGPQFQTPEHAGFGRMTTRESFANYHLRLDFKWGQIRYAPRDLQRRNSGVLYHLAPDNGTLYPDGVEFQIEETDVGDAIMINTKALPGPLLGGTPLWPNYFPGLPRIYEPPIVVGPIARQWFRHAGQFETLEGWNTLDLYAFDDQAAHLVNGRIVMTLFSMIGRDSAHPGASVPLTRGRIALELEGAEISFRNVMIRDLGADEIKRIRGGR